MDSSMHFKRMWLNRAVSLSPQAPLASCSSWVHHHSPSCSCQDLDILLDCCPSLTHPLCLWKQWISLALLSRKIPNTATSHLLTQLPPISGLLSPLFGKCRRHRPLVSLLAFLSLVVCSLENSESDPSLRTLVPWFSDSFCHHQCHTSGFTVAHKTQCVPPLPTLPSFFLKLSLCMLWSSHTVPPTCPVSPYLRAFALAGHFLWLLLLVRVLFFFFPSNVSRQRPPQSLPVPFSSFTFYS